MKIEILHPSKITLDAALLKQIVIAESSGMLKRTPGEKFEKEGFEYEFVKSLVLPPKGGKYNTQEELNNEINQFLDSEKLLLSDENKIGDLKNGKSAMIIVLNNTETNEKIPIIKLTRNVSTTTIWTQTSFGAETGFKVISANKQKISNVEAENLKIKPFDLVGDEKRRELDEFKTHVISRAKELVDSGQLPELCYAHINSIFESVEKKSPVILAGGGMYSAAYNKYLGEILAPVSVITGWLSTGDREKSEKILLEGRLYSDMGIIFNQSKTENLFDSTLEEDNVSVKISSKAGKGAAASIKSLTKVIENFKNRQPEQFDIYVKKYPKIFEIISTILQESQYDGPVELGLKLNVLNQEDYQAMKEILKNKNVDLNTFKELVAKQTIKLTDSLNTIAKTYKNVSPLEIEIADSKYNPVFHILSAIAKQVVVKINEDANFNVAVKELLSYSNLIQVNSKIKILGPDKKDCQFTEFEVKYPPQFAGSVIADCSGEYTATQIRGKISFKIP